MDLGHTVKLGAANPLGFRAMELTKQDNHLGEVDVSARRLAVFAHLSDTHICDSQSPVRMSFADHYGDPHHPFSAFVSDPIGAYRPNEMLTTQVFASMIATINRLQGADSNLKLDAVLITGDITDNAQGNELDWAKSILGGKRTTPNSGSTRYEGPSGLVDNPNFWHPDGEPNHPTQRYGYPVVPGLLEAAISSFTPEALESPVHLVHGNHDLLAVGSFVYDESMVQKVLGSRAPESFVSDSAAIEAASSVSQIGPSLWPREDGLLMRELSADAARLPIGESGWSGSSERFFATMVGQVLVISLDTVNPHGGYEGSIDEQQLGWLERILVENPKTPTLIAAHHPLDKLINTYSPKGQRVGGEQLTKVLAGHKQVLAYLAGHDHQHQIEDIGGHFWHIETGSLIDWPQEGRLIEILETDDEYLILTTVFAHQGEVGPLNPGAKHDLANLSHLAGIARQLGANHWQRRGAKHSVEQQAGAPKDRNTVLRLPKNR